MAAARRAADHAIVIAGNPNTGKSTLFNQLTGGSVRVGNYPGITVERSRGRLTLPTGTDVEVLDSPGTYSLVARSPEEELSLEAIAGLPPLARPDLVVVTVDATQLARNLYLVLQIIELDVPVVVALNMVDALEESGIDLDVDAIARELGVPVLPVVARRGEGIDALVTAIDRTLAAPDGAAPTGAGNRGQRRWRPISTPSRPRCPSPGMAAANAGDAHWRSGRCCPSPKPTASNPCRRISPRW